RIINNLPHIFFIFFINFSYYFVLWVKVFWFCTILRFKIVCDTNYILRDVYNNPLRIKGFNYTFNLGTNRKSFFCQVPIINKPVSVFVPYTIKLFFVNFRTTELYHIIYIYYSLDLIKMVCFICAVGYYVLV